MGAPTVTTRDYRFLIIGKTGNGKSALGNAILGVKRFTTGNSMSGTTLETEYATVDKGDNRITVIDTPDIINEEKNKEEMKKEVAKWQQLCRSGLSAVLLAVRCDRRYTKEEHDIYKEILKLWGKNLRKRLIVVFTYGDKQQLDIDEELRTTAPDELKSVLKDAGGRYVLFKNLDFAMDMASTSKLFPEGEMRIALIGKTGAGKSSTANTIIGKDLCDVSSGMSSATQESGLQSGTWNGLKVSVIDTPGVCDTDRGFEEVHREICKSVGLAIPGPHAILMCLKCNDRFTKEELEAYLELKELFGHGLVKYMILSFSGLDGHKGVPPDFIKEGQKNPKLGQVLADLNQKADRIFPIDNTACREERNKQSCKLLQIIADMVAENGGECYSNDITKMFKERMKEKAEKENKTIEQVKDDIVHNEPVVEDLKKALPPGKVKSRRQCTIL